jgi:hypothetical protein
MIKKIGLSFASISAGFMVTVQEVFAQTTPTPVTITSPFSTGNVGGIISGIVNNVALLFLFIIGLVMLGLIIYAGFLYMTDAGNEENVKKSRKIITSAVIGLVIVAFTGIIVQFIERIFGINLCFISCS